MNTRLLSVNLGPAHPLRIGERTVLSAIRKHPASGPVACGPLGLAGDEQADLSVHGGLSKAVYAYPSEHLAFWRTVRAQAKVAGWHDDVPPGLLGENLTLAGLTEGQMWVGDRWHFPSGLVLVVSEPRRPCDKLNAALGFNQAVKMMVQSGYCGTYLAVLTPGTLQAGECFEVLPGPRELNLGDLFRARTAGRHFQ